MSLNVKKTKEIRISFFKKPVQFDNLTSAGTEINIVDNFKLLGVTIILGFNLEHSCRCNMHQSQQTIVCIENSQAFWSATKGYYVCLLRIYQTSSRICMSSVAFLHTTTPQRLQIEQVQLWALRIALPHLSCSDGIEAMNIQTLNNVDKITAINFIRTFLFRKIIK